MNLWARNCIHEKDVGFFQCENQSEYHSLTEHTHETRRHAVGSGQLRNGSQERNSDNSSLLEEHKVINLFMYDHLVQSGIYSVKLTFLC